MEIQGDWLPPTLWHAKVFDGRWVAGSDVADVVEPATGQRLGQIGLADAAAVGRACAAAAAAQPAWAALPGGQRADVLRRAGELARAHAGEIAMWLTREAGSSRAKAAVEAAITATALLEASQLPSGSWVSAKPKK